MNTSTSQHLGINAKDGGFFATKQILPNTDCIIIYVYLSLNIIRFKYQVYAPLNAFKSIPFSTLYMFTWWQFTTKCYVVQNYVIQNIHTHKRREKIHHILSKPFLFLCKWFQWFIINIFLSFLSNSQTWAKCSYLIEPGLPLIYNYLIPTSSTTPATSGNDCNINPYFMAARCISIVLTVSWLPC